jgi:C4-dicarboxylate transporter DctQ subunit
VKAFYDGFCKAQNIIISVFLVMLVGVILIGAFCRYTQIAILNWPDELTRYIMVWIVFIGSGSAASNNTHFRIEMAFSLLRPTAQIALIAFKAALVTCLYAFVLYISVSLTQKMMMMRQVSPAMGIPMWMMYLAVPVGCALMLAQGLICDVQHIGRIRRKVRGEEV